MPVNRNALIRYKTIDKCLQNRYRTWTLEDLIEECSEVLYEYEGIDKGVSRRTIQADLQVMRSDKLGYNAPIVVIDRKFYTYEDPAYSITNIPISSQDLDQLGEAVQMLKQFSGFKHFEQLNGMVQKLEDHVYSTQTHTIPVIDFEKNENLKGIELLDQLYQAIVKKELLSITYKSFTARAPSTFDYSAYLLKEYANRWFLIGKKSSDAQILMLALDRIEEVKKGVGVFQEEPTFDPSTFFENVIGVTVNRIAEPVQIEFFADHKTAPYIVTKPIHSSQKVIERNHFGVKFSLLLKPNFELEKVLLGFGEQIRILKPERLRRKILGRLMSSVDNYDAEVTPAVIKRMREQLKNRGSFLLPKGYPVRFVNRMNLVLKKWFMKHNELAASTFAIREILQKVPELQPYVFSEELITLLHEINPKLHLVKSIYFDKRKEADWYVTWHQDRTINVMEKRDVKGFSGWTFKEGMYSVIPPDEIRMQTVSIRIHLDRVDDQNGALLIFPGSHKRSLLDEEVRLITDNGSAQSCQLEAGGMHIFKPLILHKSNQTHSDGRRRVIHLEFAPKELPGGLRYKELHDLRTHAMNP